MTAPVWMASPPEVHSTLLSSGPGAGSLLAVSAACSALSAEAYVSAHLPYLAWLTEAGANSAGAATTMAAYHGVAGSALASSPRTAAAPPVLKTDNAVSAAADPSAGNFFTDIYNQLVALIQDPSGTLSAILANPSAYFPLLFFIAYEVSTSIGATITYPSLIAGSILAIVLPAALQQLLANPAAASGLSTLNSNALGNGPRMPMVPGTWSSQKSEGEGECS